MFRLNTLRRTTHTRRCFRPQFPGNITNQPELVKHLLLRHAIRADGDTGKPALRADANVGHGLGDAPALSAGDDPRGLAHAALDRLGVLEPRVLGGHDAQHDVLAPGQEAERLEPPGARVVVLEEEGVVVEGGEELLGDFFVRPLAEVHRFGKVACQSTRKKRLGTRQSCHGVLRRWTGLTSAYVKPNMHVGRPAGNAVIVRPQVQVQQAVGIVALGAQGRDHVVGAKVGEGRVVNLQVAQAGVVQGPDLPAVGARQVGEEGLVVGVDARLVGFARGQAEVEVARRRHGKLAGGAQLLGHRAAQELPVVEIRAGVVGDPVLAHGGHHVLPPGLLEGGDGRRRRPRELPRHGADLPEPSQLLEESREVVLAVELARRQGADAVGALLVDNVGDGVPLGLAELGGGDGAGVGLLLEAGQGRRPYQRANVVRVEWQLMARHDASAEGECVGRESRVRVSCVAGHLPVLVVSHWGLFPSRGDISSGHGRWDLGGINQRQDDVPRAALFPFPCPGT